MVDIILVVIGGVVGLAVLSPYLARALANHNLFFTLIKEGEGKAFLHNEAFEKAAIRYKGFRLDGRWNVVESNRREKLTVAEAKAKGSTWNGQGRRKEDKWWNKFFGGGLTYVGIWPFDTVHRYEFRWVAPKEGKDEPHKKILDFAFAKASIYTVEIKNAETKGMVPLDMKLHLTIRLVNLYKPLFRCHQWLEFVISRLGPYVREFVPRTGLEFEDFIKVEQLPGGPLFEFLRGKGTLTEAEKQFYREDGYSQSAINSLEKAGGGILAIFKEAFGIAVEGIEFASINSVNDEYEKSASKEWSAKQDKKAIKVLASAEAKKIDIIAEAEARKIRTVSQAIQDYGEIGLASKAMDTIKEASTKPGNWIIPSNLLDALKIGGQSGQEKKKKGGDKK